MNIGISTASLFMRKTTEDALEFLGENGVDVAEVFLESYCEYNKEFGRLLNERKGQTSVHSVHVLTTQFEPQLYSVNERAKADSFKLLDMAMQAGESFGAKYYTFHGGARFKKTPFTINYDRVGSITQDIYNVAKSHGITLAYENVHWGYYNYFGFFSELKKHVPNLKATLDIKQARQSDIHYKEFIKDMGEGIVTVHLSDYLESGKMCLPGKGVTDFADLFKRLKDVNFNGALILEAYQNDYGELNELLQSLDYIKELSYKIF